MVQQTHHPALKDQGLRVGLLGGSFNPAHEGHVEMSLYALEKLGLDQVWWLVSPQNPLKSKKGMAGFKERLVSAHKLAKQHSLILVSDLENMLETCYTIDTITALKRLMPKTKFVWLMGEDNLNQFDQWHRWEDIFFSVPIAVFNRSGYAAGRNKGEARKRFASAKVDAKNLVDHPPPAWTVLDNKHNEISSTIIRQRIKIRGDKEKDRSGGKSESRKKNGGKKISGKKTCGKKSPIKKS